jgi:hypothetical protein
VSLPTSTLPPARCAHVLLAASLVHGLHVAPPLLTLHRCPDFLLLSAHGRQSRPLQRQNGGVCTVPAAGAPRVALRYCGIFRQRWGFRGRRKEGEKEEWDGSPGTEEEEHGRFHDGKETSISCEAVAGDPRRDIHASAIWKRGG